MSDLSFPLEPSTSQMNRPSGRHTIRLERLMDEPTLQRKTPATGVDSAWGLKLKTCVDAVAREFRIEVRSAKPVQSFGTSDSRDMLFEVDTTRGVLEVLRTRTGEHRYHWKSSGVFAE